MITNNIGVFLNNSTGAVQENINNCVGWESVFGLYQRVCAERGTYVHAPRTLQGNYKEALPLYMRSRVILEKVLGPEHPEVATMLYNLAGLLEAQVRGFYCRAFHEKIRLF